MKKVLLGLICLLSLVSCKKGQVAVVYSLGVSVESTDPEKIADLEIRDTYVTLMRDLQKDIEDFNPHIIPFLDFPQELTVEINKAVWLMDPKDVPAEDERRIAEFNDHLPRIKEVEASYRERIEKLEKRDGVSFRINGQLLLLKATGDTKKDGILKEYDFELKYN